MEDRIRSLQEKVVEGCTESAELRDKLAAEKRDSSPASKEYLRNLGISPNLGRYIIFWSKIFYFSNWGCL